MLDPKLYTLLEVLKEESYTKAAKKLSLTQPAVTQHIKQLEKELGVKILIRTKNQIKASLEGEILVEYARRNIALYEKMLQSIADSMGSIRKLSVGITHTAESNAAALALANYSAKNKGMTINITTAGMGDLCERLKNYEIDLAIVEGDCQDPTINSLLLDRDTIVLVMSKDNHLRNREAVSIEELMEEPLILRRPLSSTRDLILSYLKSRQLSIDDFNVILEVDNVSTIKNLVEQGVGLSFLPRSTCLNEIKKKTLKVLDVKDLNLVRNINILYLKSFNRVNLLESLVNEYRLLT